MLYGAYTKGGAWGHAFHLVFAQYGRIVTYIFKMVRSRGPGITESERRLLEINKKSHREAYLFILPCLHIHGGFIQEGGKVLFNCIVLCYLC